MNIFGAFLDKTDATESINIDHENVLHCYDVERDQNGNACFDLVFLKENVNPQQ